MVLGGVVLFIVGRLNDEILKGTSGESLAVLQISSLSVVFCEGSIESALTPEAQVLTNEPYIIGLLSFRTL